MELEVTVKFNGRDPIAEMVKLFGESLVRNVAGPVPAPKVTVTTAPDAQKRGRGRPRHADVPHPGIRSDATPAVAQTVGVVTAVAVEPEPPFVQDSEFKRVPPEEVAKLEESVEHKPYLLADVQAALEKLFNAKGASVAIDLLKRFEVTRAKELKPEQFGEFIVGVEMELIAK